jgi:hypothetical protein
MGTPDSNGSITWCATEQVVIAGVSGVSYGYPSICVDSNGFYWIAITKATSPYSYMVLKSSTDNGVWTTANGFPLSISASTAVAAQIVPLINGQIAFTYLNTTNNNEYIESWSGSAWNTAVRMVGVDPVSPNGVSLVNYGDNVYFAWSNTTSQYPRELKYTYSSNSVGAPVSISTTINAVYPALSINPNSGILYCFWINPSPLEIQYTEFNSSWGAPSVLLADSTLYNSLEPLSVSYSTAGNYIGVLFADSSSPYNVCFDYLTNVAPIFQITASSDSNSVISPSGIVTVPGGVSQTFTFTANSGYGINSVIVNGVNQGDLRSYTFSDVQANNTISCTSALIPTWPSQAPGSQSQTGVINSNGVAVGAGSVEAGVQLDERNSVYANGLWWDFYCMNSENTAPLIMYATSPDGLTWTNNILYHCATGSPNCVSVASTGSDFNLAIITGEEGVNSTLLYAFVSPSAGGSLTYITNWQTVVTETSSCYLQACKIFLDASQCPWISYTIIPLTGGNQKSVLDHSTSNDGLWNSQGGIFPYVLESGATDYSSWSVSLAAYPNGDMQTLVTPSGSSVFESYLFSGSALVSSFNTTFIQDSWTCEQALIITPNNQVFFLVPSYYPGNTPAVDATATDVLIELSQTAVINSWIIPTVKTGYGDQLSYSTKQNALFIVNSGGTNLTLYLLDLNSFSLSPAYLLQSNAIQKPESQEQVTLSFTPETNSSNYLLTYIGSNNELNSLVLNYAALIPQTITPHNGNGTTVITITPTPTPENTTTPTVTTPTSVNNFALVVGVSSIVIVVGLVFVYNEMSKPKPIKWKNY